jgi:hypothetical protein
MKCNKCGFESERGTQFCVNCGQPCNDNNTQIVEPVSINPAADKILGALKDNLYLVLCIIMSASCIFSISADGLPLINILTTVFLWLAYVDARKGIANENHLRSVSGTVYASYVITNVACIILIVCGLLFGVLFSIVASAEEVIDELQYALSEYNLGEYGLNVGDIPKQYVTILGWAVGFVFVFAAVIGLLVNILGMKKIHRFAKSVYQGIIYQNPNFENARAVKNWLVFFAVCSSISTLSTITSIYAFGTACSTAALIIAAILVNKYFVTNTYCVE